MVKAKEVIYLGNHTSVDSHENIREAFESDIRESFHSLKSYFSAEKGWDCEERPFTLGDGEGNHKTGSLVFTRDDEQVKINLYSCHSEHGYVNAYGDYDMYDVFASMEAGDDGHFFQIRQKFQNVRVPMKKDEHWDMIKKYNQGDGQDLYPERNVVSEWVPEEKEFVNDPEIVFANMRVLDAIVLSGASPDNEDTRMYNWRVRFEHEGHGYVLCSSDLGYNIPDVTTSLFDERTYGTGRYKADSSLWSRWSGYLGTGESGEMPEGLEKLVGAASVVGKDVISYLERNGVVMGVYNQSRIADIRNFDRAYSTRQYVLSSAYLERMAGKKTIIEAKDTGLMRIEPVEKWNYDVYESTRVGLDGKELKDNRGFPMVDYIYRKDFGTKYEVIDNNLVRANGLPEQFIVADKSMYIYDNKHKKDYLYTKKVDAGDYLNVTDTSNVSVIPKKIFEQAYTAIKVRNSSLDTQKREVDLSFSKDENEKKRPAKSK